MKKLMETIMFLAMILGFIYVFTLERHEIAYFNSQIDSLGIVKETKQFLQIK